MPPGGPIKESKIGMAQVQRALGRKEEPAKDDAGAVEVAGTDVHRFEEKAQVCRGLGVGRVCVCVWLHQEEVRERAL